MGLERLACWSEYEHPDHGVVRVLWLWVHGEWSSALVPAAVEFDLFTPDSVQAELTRELACVRVDRSLSVSGSIPTLEG